MALLFFIYLLLLFYTFAGYPLLLWFWSQRKIDSETKLGNFQSSANSLGQELPTLDIVMVVHNGANYIQAKLKNLSELEYNGKRPRIIIVLDGCTDNTEELIAAANYSSVHVIKQKEKSGKPYGLNLGVAASDAVLLLMTDVRQPIKKDALERLARRFEDPQIAAVSGELVFKREGITDFGKGMDAYWRYEKFIRDKESTIDSVAGVTGAIYVLRKSYYDPIPAETLLDDVLIPMQAVLKGGKVKFESGAYAFDIPSNDIQRERIRKTRTLAGNFQLVQLNPSLVNPFKNPIWFQFVSHKMLRLLSPFLLLSIFISNALLVGDHWFYSLTMAGQLAFYAIAAIAFFSESARKIKLLSVIHSFLNLMLYTFYGFLAYVRGNYGDLWK